METNEEKIITELKNLHLILGHFHNLSENIIQHALSTNYSKVN